MDRQRFTLLRNISPKTCASSPTFPEVRGCLLISTDLIWKTLCLMKSQNSRSSTVGCARVTRKKGKGETNTSGGGATMSRPIFGEHFRRAFSLRVHMFPPAGATFALPLVLFFTAGVAIAQEKPAVPSPEKPAAAMQEKSAGNERGNAADGARMYRWYCAACHGRGGLGDGPVASLLLTKPADLTVLAQRHGGKFPTDYVAKVLRFGVNKPAHGTRDMPTWGPVFAGNIESSAQEKKKIADMISYLESIQRRPKKK